MTIQFPDPREAAFIVIILICVAGIAIIIQPKVNGPLEVNNISLKIISKTEYTPGDAGQVIVEIRDKQYNPINASCLTDVLYPNKTYFVQNESMISTILGTEYINFTVPTLDGVFEYSVNCTYDAKNYVDGSSFHVSKGRMKAWIEK
jgi:hypothetical protein